MRVLITGASGFLGQELAASLLASPIESIPITELILTDLSAPPHPSPTTTSETKVTLLATDLTQPSSLNDLLSPGLEILFLFHGIMSAASESNLALGLAVNLDATLNIIRRLAVAERRPPPKVIYASVLAAYGPPSLLPDPDTPITEFTAPNPQSSYGTQKVMIESLLNDFSRRNLLDARILRLPTITPRSAAPTGAASAFASTLITEPLQGRPTTLPLSDKSLSMYVCSPETILRNFRHAVTLPTTSFAPFASRTVIMPGVDVSVEEMLNALAAVSPRGSDVLELVVERRDEAVERIVASWPSKYDFSRALALGFARDEGFGAAVKAYFERFVKSI